MATFTPEQQAEIDKRMAAIHAEYDSKAHWFREWVNKHDALWAARRFGAVGVAIGAVAVFYGMRLYNLVFG